VYLLVYFCYWFGSFVSWLNDSGKDVIYVQNAETNEVQRKVQRITSEPNKVQFPDSKRYIRTQNPAEFEAIISRGSEQVPIKFRLQAAKIVRCKKRRAHSRLIYAVGTKNSACECRDILRTIESGLTIVQSIPKHLPQLRRRRPRLSELPYHSPEAFRLQIAA
jgi:hypothetical protein